MALLKDQTCLGLVDICDWVRPDPELSEIRFGEEGKGPEGKRTLPRRTGDLEVSVLTSAQK